MLKSICREVITSLKPADEPGQSHLAGITLIFIIHLSFFSFFFKHFIILNRSQTWKYLFSLSTQLSGRLHLCKRFQQSSGFIPV